MGYLHTKKAGMLLLLLLTAACDNRSTISSDSDTTVLSDNQSAELGAWGVETDYFSSMLSPGDDFFTYVNEGWLATVDFPPGLPRIDSFIALSLQAEADIREIIAEASTDPQNDNQRFIAAFHDSYMNTEKLDTLGLQPVQSKLDAIVTAQDRNDLTRLMQDAGYTSIIGLGVDIDTNDPSRYILSFHQSGLGLPSREYYLLDDAPYPDHRVAYSTYMSDLFTMAGMHDQLALVPEILNLEFALANAHWSNADMRDPVRMTHYMTLAELAAFAPGIDWLDMINSLGGELTAESVIVANTDTALSATAALYSNTSLETLKAYMAFHVLDNYAEYLGEQWKNRHFAFYGTQLNGLAQQRSREEDAINKLNLYLGEIVGEEYVRRHFPPEYRESLMTYIDYLKEAFRERLEILPWMDVATRTEALAKLELLNAEIGYPRRWHDYSSLTLVPDDLVGNIDQIMDWTTRDAIAKLNEPQRDWEWGNNPQEINAYYSPARNQVVFLAGILRAPFFDPAADFAVNFGSILGVIGHEVSHGFDDQGSQYDGTGRLRDWWSAASRQEFQTRAQRLAAQYDAYEPVPGAHVNGRLTLGENIGDLGGISVAFHAMQKYISEQYPNGAPLVDGYTAEQRFFLAWAQMWRGKRTEDYARQLLLIDPHSPSMYRANGIVRNLDAWYEAFDIDSTAALYLSPEERITIW